MAYHRGFTILLCRSGASKELDSNIENGIGSLRGKNNSSGKACWCHRKKKSPWFRGAFPQRYHFAC